MAVGSGGGGAPRPGCSAVVRGGGVAGRGRTVKLVVEWSALCAAAVGVGCPLARRRPRPWRRREPWLVGGLRRIWAAFQKC